MAYTTIGVRWSIITAWKRFNSISQAAEHVKCSYKVAQRWVRKYKATGEVEDAHRSGRKQVLSPLAAEKAYELLLSGQFGGAKMVAMELKAQGYTEAVVHRTTIVRAARRLAELKGTTIHALRGKPKKLLSAATKSKRLQFSLSHKRTSWASTMFTDRKKFLFSYPGTKVHPVTWAEKGEERRAAAVNHPMCVNVYAGLTKHGMTKLHVVAGTSKHKTTYTNKQGQQAKNITSSEYEDVLTKTLLPEGQKIFATQGIASWTLQQDNDPTHKAAGDIVKQYNVKHGCSISLLPRWPPSSPDLSLIENIWSIMQLNMDAKGCKSFEEFKAELEIEAKNVSKQVAGNLFASMAKRIQTCIARHGDKTPY